jgi:polyisoprenyl-teichoic acid--peptidoglycan teichoic acid transferase
LEYASSAVLDRARDEPPSYGQRSKPPRRGGRGSNGGPKDPLWARVLVIVGALLMLGSGAVVIGNKVLFDAATGNLNRADLLDPGAAKQHVTINGAKNILLVGVDQRPNEPATDLIRSDSIILLHIPATHDRAYLVSIPRDSYVDIPAFNNGVKTIQGGHDRINAAFAWGGEGLSGVEQRKYGFRLLQQTIKQDFGVTFDAGAIVDFMGFQDVVAALGGVTMCVDEKVTSIHVGFNKDGKKATPYLQDGGHTFRKVAGVTPQVYLPGCQHMEAWQALDYVRQRDFLGNGDGDYGRQRHQQQFIKAVFKGILEQGILSNPTKLPALLNVVGKAMLIDDGGIGLEDWIFAMRSIGSSDIVTIKTNAGRFNPGQGSLSGYEMVSPESMQLFSAMQRDKVEGFIADHSDWVSQSAGN